MEAREDDVEFLARSPNRASVLESLSTGPHDHPTLEASTGASRVTLGRILSAFDDRGWAERSAGRWQLTPLGTTIHDAYAEALETMGMVSRLASIADLFPTAETGIELETLASAEITLPTVENPFAPIHRANAVLDAARGERILVQFVADEILRPCAEGVVERDEPFEVVADPQTIRTAAVDPVLAGLFRDVLEAGRTVAQYEGDRPIPLNLGILPDAVAIGLLDEQSLPRAFIVSENPELRDRAEELYESFRREATPVDASVFEP